MIEADFLIWAEETHAKGIRCDKICMNPPFSEGMALAHVHAAATLAAECSLAGDYQHRLWTSENRRPVSQQSRIVSVSRRRCAYGDHNNESFRARCVLLSLPARECQSPAKKLFQAAVRETKGESGLSALEFPWGDDSRETGPYSKGKVGLALVARASMVQHSPFIEHVQVCGASHGTQRHLGGRA